MNKSIALLIPCFNEEKTIGKVVRDFQKYLPENSTIYVYDNNSTDNTVKEARTAGAVVGFEKRQGKGNVVRKMLREITADVYLLVDGDDTYPAEQVDELIEPILSGQAQMSVGTRLDCHTPGSFRSLHKFGNRMICGAINFLFNASLEDVLSGYRCFDSVFVKSIPLLSSGFEVETELTLQSLDKGFNIVEVPIKYRDRPEGSHSKLNTYFDGFLVLKTIFWIFKDYKPLRFFSIFGLFNMVLGFGLGSIPVIEFIKTGLVNHLPTAVLSTGLVLVSLLSFSTGFILDTLNRRQQEQYHLLLNYISKSTRD